MNKPLSLLFTVLLAVTARAEDKPTPAKHNPDDVVARVGDETIKWKEVDTAVRAFAKQFTAYGQPFPEEQLPQLQYSIVNDMVSHDVIVKATKGHEPKDIDELTTKQIEQTKLQLGGEEGLAKALSEMGVTREEYTTRLRESLAAQALIKQVVDDRVKITPDEVKKFYDDNRSKFVVPERVRASHILILVPQDATPEVRTQKLTQIKAALSLVKGGDKFEDVARKFSEDPGSATQGGDLNYFTRDRMVKEFADVAFALKPNEISDVVTSQFGYHVIKVTDRKPAGERPYDEAKNDIEKYLKNAKGKEVAESYIQELRGKTKIEILIAKPEPVSVPSRSSMPAPSMPTVETKPVAAPKP